MSWKSFIKFFIPPIPFLPRIRSQILGLDRSSFKPKRQDTDLYIFHEAEFEKDCDDIIASFPADELGFPDSEQLRKEIIGRFQKQIRCFIVRKKEDNLLLGAVWIPAEGFGFLSRKQTHFINATYKVVNLFICPERRVRGLGKQLLSFAIERIFASTVCKSIVCQVVERADRLPSLLAHMRLGFSVLGTLKEQKFFGIYLPRFVRKNTHPFFCDFPKTPVIVLTHDGANLLGIARSLGRRGVPVYVLTPDQQTSMSWSRYVSQIFTVSSLENKDEMRKRLEDLLRKIDSQSCKPILIVTNESHYFDLEPLKGFVEEHFNLVNPLDKVIPLAIKSNQFPLAAQVGFRVLETVVLHNVDDLNQVENKLVFPLIVRPSSNNLRGKFESKVELHENIETLRSTLTPVLADDGVELIVQEFIPGNDRDVVFFMASCDEFGEPRMWLAGRKIRQNPPGMGLMCAGIVEASPDTAFVERCFSLCRLFKLRGFIGIEAKRHAITHEFCYIESSVRTEGNSSIGLATKIDLVWDAYLATLNKPCGAVRPEKCKGSWANLELELGTMKILKNQGDPDWWKVIIPLPRPIVHAYFTWDDPLPFFHHFGTLLLKRIKKCLSKKP